MNKCFFPGGNDMYKPALYFLSIFLVLDYVWIYVFYEDDFMRLWGAGFIMPVVGAGISLFWLFRTYQRLVGKQKYFWLLLSLANLFFIIAQSIWFSYYAISRSAAPYPSWADAFWLMQYLVILIALIYKMTLIKEVSISRVVFNIIIFMTVAITLSAHFLIYPILKSGANSSLTNIVSLTNPLLDLGVLFAVVSLYYTSQYSANRKVLLLISLGFFIQIITDSAFSYLLSIGKHVVGGVLDPLWLIPLFLNGMAGLVTKKNSIETGTEQNIDKSDSGKFHLFPYVGVIVLLLLVLLSHRKQSIDSLEVGLVVVMLLIIIRQILIMVDNRNLLRELKNKNDEIGKSEERYRHLVEINPHATCVTIDGIIRFVNKAGLELYGTIAPGEIIGKSLFDIIPQKYNETLRLRIQKASKGKQAIDYFEYPILRLDGQIINVESSLAEIQFNGEKAYLSVVQDITNRKEIEERIKFMAYYDELTELPNRAMFHKNLTEQIEIARNNNGLVAVLFIDLDRFKFINDSMGHRFGDLFLKQVAQRLKQVIDHNVAVHRHGGDEFCIIIENADQSKLSLISQQIVTEFSTPFTVENREFFTTASIGISLYPSDGEDMDTLIRLADIAMFNAKKQGGNNYVFYNKVIDEVSSKKMNIENELRKAIKCNDFIVHYQPKVNLITGEIIGLEALVRWQHPEWGLVPPLDFISVAEETGLIIPIGKWVLQEACQQMRKWHVTGFLALSIAVNISPRQLQDKNLITIVAEVLRESELDPQYLEIEVTETIMQNIEESVFILNELKKLGVQISIDDFGTGYSSLSYLKHLPIDNIKIDKSFVDDITINSKDEAIIKTIIDMGHHLKINVTAEGIENEQQLQSLKGHQCHVGQGYLFSRPLPPAEVEKLFKHLF
jgi:diguanylate cyclase (GGDEF)-like protein/PAS domain S-box-containing protein